MLHQASRILSPGAVRKTWLPQAVFWLAVALIASYPLAMLMPGLTGFPYPSISARFSDFSISHYPNALFLQRSLAAGQIPLWSPLILSGAPFAGDPLSGLWYPPGWVALFFPLPLGLNLVALLHIIWGGVGMGGLLHSEGLAHWPAVWGALAFTALPKLYGHYGAGHLTLLYAVSWTPWLFWAARGFSWNSTAGERRHRQAVSVILQPVILALIFTADPRWAAMAGLAWLFYWISHRFLRHSRLTSSDHSSRSSSGWLACLRTLGLQILAAGMLAAPLGLPLIEYVRLSTRVEMAAVERMAYSLPPAMLLGLVFPGFGGHHEWVIYLGWGTLVLALCAFAWPAVRRGRYFWIFLVAGSLLFAMGDAIPGLAWLTGLPGLSLLRVPSRALFLTGFALILLAASALNHVFNGVEERERRTAGRLLAGLVLFTLLLSGGVAFLTRQLPVNFSWGAGMAIIVAVWLLLCLKQLAGRKSRLAWVWASAWIVLCLVDWVRMDNSLFISRTAGDVLSEGQAVAEIISTGPKTSQSFSRVYSPSYSMPQGTAAYLGLELSDGVNPMQLARYAAWMAGATGIPSSGYSVTVPSYLGDDPKTANAAYQPDPQQLGLLNVRWVLADFDLLVEGLALYRQVGETRVYENQFGLPRAWLQPLNQALGKAIQPVEKIQWAPNRITIRADAGNRERMRLVLSEIAYPGWSVTIDGKPAPVVESDGLLRGVDLPSGAHTIVFSYQPGSVYLGLAVSFFSWVGLVLVALHKKGREA